MAHLESNTLATIDFPPCPNCGELMLVTGRWPHSFCPEKFEEQFLLCHSCGQSANRSIDHCGKLQPESGYFNSQR